MNDIGKIILDTDIGDDIDDAFALLLLSESNKAEVLGVTTVFRNASKRAKMASYLLRKLHKDTPVYPGIDMPLKAKIENIVPLEIRQKEKVDEDGKYHLPQYASYMDEAAIEKKDAVSFIIESVHRYPGEVTIIPIGPLTNIATAFRKDPSIIPLIKEVRLMGGGLGLNFAEWNMWCDPEAANIVYNSGVNLTTVGLNVTCKTQLDEPYIKMMKESKSKALSIVYDMMMKWFEHYQFTAPVMHDPLTVASLLDPGILKFEDKHLDIILDGPQYGYVVERDSNPHWIHYASDVDKQRFFQLLKSVIFEHI